MRDSIFTFRLTHLSYSISFFHFDLPDFSQTPCFLFILQRYNKTIETNRKPESEHEGVLPMNHWLWLLRVKCWTVRGILPYNNFMQLIPLPFSKSPSLFQPESDCAFGYFVSPGLCNSLLFVLYWIQKRRNRRSFYEALFLFPVCAGLDHRARSL